MLTNSMKTHPFSSAVWDDARAVMIYFKDKGLAVESADLDEYQFYITRVGYSLAHLVTWMEQIEHAVHYLSDFSYSRKIKREGINRTHHLLYNVENYLIRLQSVYDRSLQLTNSVFHLCTEESNVSHSVIVSNLKVSRTPVAGLLKALKRSIEPKAQERHEIIHRASYQDADLRELELFYMFEKETWEKEPGARRFEHLSHIRIQLMKKVVAQRGMNFRRSMT